MSERDLPIRSEMERIPPYNSGLTLAEVRARYQVETISKLGSNENPLGSSKKVTDCLASPGELFRLYPDPQGRALCEAIAVKFGVAPEQIVLGNGSEDLIGVICRAAVRSGDVVTTLYPSFPLHEDYAVLMGGKVERIRVRPDLEIDLPALLAAARRAPRDDGADARSQPPLQCHPLVPRPKPIPRRLPQKSRPALKLQRR